MTDFVTSFLEKQQQKFHQGRGKKLAREVLWQWLWIAVVLLLLSGVFAFLGKSPLSSSDLAFLLAGTELNLAGGAAGFTKAFEYTLMIGLWVFLAIVLASPYIIHTVSKKMFYSSERQCAAVEDAVVAVTREFPDDLEARHTAWLKQFNKGVLKDLRSEDSHLAEVTNQISAVVLASNHTLDRYFMTQARDIKEEEYQKLSLVNLAANVGPVLGFAGTILGMILAFAQLGQELSKDVLSDIAGAIYVALITTLLGLIIKALASMVKFLIQHKVDSHVTRILTISGNITRKLVAPAKSAAESEAESVED